jgi:ZIP family zinc transporter
MIIDWNILLISTISGLATGVGAIVLMFFGTIRRKMLSALLGFAAGIMIAISTFGLLPQALEFGSVTLASTGFAAGLFIMLLLDNRIPHLHYFQKEGVCGEYAKMGIFIALGIALHNLPEGLALGAGFEAAPTFGKMIALAIALHNIPEGIGIACPLKMAGVTPGKIFLITATAGLFTPLGTLLGFFLFNLSTSFISMSMGFAAGAMIYIVSDELIPESHRHHSHSANIGIALGILLTFIGENMFH